MLIKTGTQWDVTVDVVVIGFGCAGVVAAATARDEGADVLILEKQGQESHHTNSSMSGGIFISSPDVKEVTRYLETLCRVDKESSWTDKDIIRVWAEYSADNNAWVEANGGKTYKTRDTGEHPTVHGYDAINVYCFKGFGFGLTNFLSEQLSKRNIPVMYDTAAIRLLTNTKGEVVGVEAESRAAERVKWIRVRAVKGVIMTCGGFEYNEEMKLQYLKVYPSYFSGSEANTGDGIKMALEVGADLWHMNCVSARFGMKYADYPIAFPPDFSGTRHLELSPGSGELSPGKRCGYLCVDKHGRRFTNENFKVHALYYELSLFDSQRLIYPRIPCYWIFDRKRVEVGAITKRSSGPAGPCRLYEWSTDNSIEIEKGWIFTAKTIRDLARSLNISPDALEETIATYNKCCEKSMDPDFGRTSSDLIPLNSPPYCAVALWPGGANTQGGPKRNAGAQIINVDGEPIPGLYGAGELGSIFGMLYPAGGGNLSECISFGRIAGNNAARRIA